MNGKDQKNEGKPEIMILERRAEKRAELSSAEIMKILRKRGARRGANSEFEAQWGRKG